MHSRDHERRDMLAAIADRARALALHELRRAVLEVGSRPVDRAVADDRSAQRLLLGIPHQRQDTFAVGVAAAPLERGLPNRGLYGIKVEVSQFGDRGGHTANGTDATGPLPRIAREPRDLRRDPRRGLADQTLLQ